MMRVPFVLVLVLALGGCVTASPQRIAPVPDAAWLSGPPEPMQEIGEDKTRLLVAVPADLDRGRRYKALVARYLFVHLLDHGAVLYGRYAKDYSMPADTNPGALTMALYKDALLRETGATPAALVSVRVELPFGDTYVMTATGPTVGCAAFLAPLRVGREAPDGTSDAYLRGALCKADGTDPWPPLRSILRSVVLRE
jgi:hypothetical protein